MTVCKRSLVLAGFLLAACASSKTELDPKFIAIHNAFVAMGMSQVGPVQQGSLVEGREARVEVSLTPQCTTFMALGNNGVRDLDLSLLDPSGNVVARDTTHEPQAVLRACVEQAGNYTMVVKMTSGAGDFVTAMWTGGAGSGGVTQVAAQTGAGNCDSPIPVTTGVMQGNTSKGESDVESRECTSDGKEIVYRIDVPSQKRLVVDIDARFDAVLYLRKDECDNEDGEVSCSEENGRGGEGSQLDEVLDPGTYFLFVDGYSGRDGAYRMNVQLTDVPSLAEVCRQARPITVGQVTTGTTTGAFDHAHGSCSRESKGPDAVYSLNVGQRSRVRITEHSDDFSPIVYVRKACTDEQSEAGCGDPDNSTVDTEAVFVGVLDPSSGTPYTVFADSQEKQSAGRFTLTTELAPDTGTGQQGDGCGDATPLTASDPQVQGDTFYARDDVGGRCGGTGSADVVYRIDLAKRGRITATMNSQEGHHIFLLTKSCTDKSGEIACAENIDETLNPGTYFLALDGTSESAIGKFDFRYHFQDIGAQETACKGATTINDGQTVTGTTTGGGDKFTPYCAGNPDAQGSGDRVYKIVIKDRTRIHLALSTPMFDGVLAIRRTCLDASGQGRSDLYCNNDSGDSHHSVIDYTVDPGTYFVVVDGYGGSNEGSYTLEYKIVK